MTCGGVSGVENPHACTLPPGTGTSRWKQVARHGSVQNKALAAARRQNVETVVSTLIKMKLEKKNNRRIGAAKNKG